ncbi:ATP-binding protein [candidate division KSB1 bacterium]|nr:ATP-binding protein [candidate division KSB1 bacterium]
MGNWKKTLGCTIPSKLEQLKCVEKLTVQAAELTQLSEDQLDNLAIAVTEAVGNAIMHGNKKDPKKEVVIQYKLGPHAIHVSIADEGGGFNPDQIANPLNPDNLMKESGRGIFILKQLMDEVKFDFSSKGTTIHMTMKIKPEKPSS